MDRLKSESCLNRTWSSERIIALVEAGLIKTVQLNRRWIDERILA